MATREHSNARNTGYERGMTKQRTGCSDILYCRQNLFLPRLHSLLVCMYIPLNSFLMALLSWLLVCMYTRKFVSHGLAFISCTKTLLVLCT